MTTEAPPQTPDWLTTVQLASRLGVPVKTVRHWRETGKGPAGIRIGLYVRYYLADVEAFEAEQLAKEQARRDAITARRAG